MARLSIFRTVRLVPMMLLISACALKHPTEDEHDRMVITEDQIESLHATSAYEVMTMTHNEFLMGRGRVQTNATMADALAVHVYVDDTYYGDVSMLRGIPVGDIDSIYLWQSYDAQYKFGSGHMGGVIQVITKH